LQKEDRMIAPPWSRARSSEQAVLFRSIEKLLLEGTSLGLDDRALLERFDTKRDGLSFAALVDSHGPMVLGTCRRILSQPQDVDDAFQATFLVLVRRAGSIRDRLPRSGFPSKCEFLKSRALRSGTAWSESASDSCQETDWKSGRRLRKMKVRFMMKVDPRTGAALSAL
jgi:hypothetical protein